MGKPAYFIVDKGEVISAWTAEELKEKYPNKKPRLYTFIPSSLEDNPAMLESNEDYADDLLANDQPMLQCFLMVTGNTNLLLMGCLIKELCK